MQLEPGNLQALGPYTIRARAFESEASAFVVGGPPDERDLFAVRNVSQGDTPGSQTKPMAVSRIYSKAIVTNVAAQGVLSLRWDKVLNFSATHTQKRVSVLARNRKTTGYQPIPVTEVSAVVYDGATNVGDAPVGVGMGTATYSQYDLDEPFGAMLAANATASGVIESEFIWTADSDRLPLVLEANEGLVLGSTNTLAFAGVFELFVAIDFVR
jgi:hypothetical protein